MEEDVEKAVVVDVDRVPNGVWDGFDILWLLDVANRVGGWVPNDALFPLLPLLLLF